MVDLYSHQIDAIRKLKSGDILVGGVGTGKSRTSIGWWYFQECHGMLPVNSQGSYHPMTSPRDLYIITTAKKRDSLDWQGDLQKFGLGTKSSLNESHVHILIDSWNNIKKYQDVEGSVFIFDEQRLVGNGTWVKSFLKIAKCNQWILLSATPGDTWTDYIPVFLANGFYKTRSEFLRKHAIYNRWSKYPKIDRFIGEYVLQNLRNRITVEMPYQKKTVPHIHMVTVPYRKEAYQLVKKKRWNPYTDQPVKNISELCFTLRKIINTDESRLVEARKILSQHPRLIIFYNFDSELEQLRQIADPKQYDIAEWNGHKHEQVPTSDRWVYLVQYTSGSEAWECIQTNCMLFWSLNYSYRTMEQAMGRIDRLNTPFTDLEYYFMISDADIDKTILKAIKTKRKFNEQGFAESIGFREPILDDDPEF